MAQSVPSGPDVVPLFTPALEQELQPQCCQRTAPFAATYQQGRQRLVFVAVRHVFSTMNGAIRAVNSGFAAPSPAIVIVEGSRRHGVNIRAHCLIKRIVPGDLKPAVTAEAK
jgi:hypothetical protein